MRKNESKGTIRLQTVWRKVSKKKTGNVAGCFFAENVVMQRCRRGRFAEALVPKRTVHEDTQTSTKTPTK